MTIEIKGHVHSLEVGGGQAGEVTVTLQLEASRLPGDPHRVKLYAKETEVSAYKVGMPVIVLVRPA